MVKHTRSVSVMSWTPTAAMSLWTSWTTGLLGLLDSVNMNVDSMDLHMDLAVVTHQKEA